MQRGTRSLGLGYAFEEENVVQESAGSVSGRVTLSQIAAFAHVSPTTASFVLSRRQDMRISAATQLRVLQAARELGYIPRRTTPPVALEHPGPVGFVSDTVATDSYAGDLIRGATAAAAEVDRLVLTVETSGSPDLESFDIDRLVDLGVREFVFAATGVWERPVPAPLVGRRVVMLNCLDPRGTVPTVLPDDQAAGREAVAVLLEQGHQAIHVVGAVSPARVAGHQRMRGITETLRQQGLTLAGVTDCEWLPSDARRAFGALLERRGQSRPTAVIAMNDRVALGVYQAAASAGVSIPHELSVVSFDDSDLAQWMHPGLTSVRLPHEAMGRLAVQVLLNPSADVRHHVPMTLTRRDSIAAPPQVVRTRRRVHTVPALSRPPQTSSPSVAARTTPAPAARATVAAAVTAKNSSALDAWPAIGHPATRALRDAGYSTLGQLHGVPRHQVAALHNLGPKALERLEVALQRHGLSLA